MKTIEIYSSKTCGPCKLLKQKLAKESFKFTHYDIEADSKVAQAAGIRAVPTILLKDGDSEVSRLVGYKVETLDTMKEFLGA